MKCRTVESNHTRKMASSINCLRPSCGLKAVCSRPSLVYLPFTALRPPLASYIMTSYVSL